MTDGEEPTGGDRPVWSLSRDEQRTLAITFVGGLASIIIGAGVIGASIALGRWVEHQNLRWLAHGGAAAWGSVVSGLLGALGGLAGLRKDAPLSSRVFGWIAASIGVFLLLVIVGVGAGIH
jgi:hypothetical protein